MASSELDLVEKVDLRLALAESDAQLEQALALFLPPLLLKLASSEAAVRQAVFRTIQNVFPRITAARSLQLPVSALLQQAKTPSLPPGADPSSVRLYSLLFLSKGIERLTPPERAALVPQVIRGISSGLGAVPARLFSVLVKLLEGWKAPQNGSAEAENMRGRLGFGAADPDELYVALKAGKFFMLQPNPNPLPAQSPGLGLEDSAFFTTDAGVAYKTYDDITKTKHVLLEFLKTGFSDRALALPLLVASTDPLTALAEPAHARFKKLDVDLESEQFVGQLVDLFLGNDKVPPAKPTLQERILAVLCKSSVAVAHPEIRQVSDTGLLSEYGRLRQTAVAFVRRVTSASSARAASAGISHDFNVLVASRLKEAVISEGWPQMDRSRITNFRAAVGLRELQYEALGDVLRNSPALWRDDLTYLRFLYASLEGESADLVPCLQGVLSALSIHLPGLSDLCKRELRVFLKGFLQSSRHDGNFNSCKYLAIKHVNCTFPFEDAEARLLCIFGTVKENNLETREEAERGLHPYHFNLLRSSNTADFISSRDYLGLHSEVAFPSFSDMVAVLAGALADPVEAAKYGRSAIKFTLSVLVMQAIKGKTTVVVIDEDWARRLDKALEMDEDVRLLVIAEIDTAARADVSMHAHDDVHPSPFHVFLTLVFEGFVGAAEPAHGSVFALLVSLSPSSVIGAFASTILRQVQSLHDRVLLPGDLRDASKALSIIVTHESNEISVAHDIMRAFAKNLSTSNDKERFISVAAHVLAKLALRQRLEEIDVGIIEHFFKVVHESLGDMRLYDTCIEGLSQLAIFGVLGPRLSLGGQVATHLEQFMCIIELKLKSFHESSVLALSKLALAMPSTYDPDSSQLLPIEQRIFDAHTSKQIEFIFTCGDALLILAGGWLSKLLRQNLDIQGQTVEYVPVSTGRLEPILNHVLQATTQSKPALRKSGCVWLLAIVQYLPSDSLIRGKATEIHSAFMRFLVDRDEMVQEAAARGLSLVYDMGDADLKETLVKGLLRSFTDANASSALSSGSVDLDTQLFDKDVLKTHDSSVSTYKDVLTLASDVGDPSLVYKFMSLAKSNALWSSRRGMAFGLGSILSKSSLDQMLAENPHLSQRLIPKLYRYKFDPNQGVSQSMNEIWTSLVGDTSKVVGEYFDPILREILKGMGSKEWRVRQASAVALNNLLQTQPMEKYEMKLEEVWNMSFRAMDDIKESVRKEGLNLSKTLARILIRSADLSTGKVSASKAAEVLDHLIPMFMGSKGLLSDVEDVRSFALETILKLCDIGGKAIRQHVPALLSNFIELMSTLEPEVINYLVLNADKYNLDSNDVDAKRLQSLGHSPMMDAIEKLMNQIDEPMMPEIVRQLKVSVKKSIGLPSKVCGSRVIVNLVSAHSAIARPFGDAMLALCESQLKDRNATVSQSYAAAAGHCCKVSSVEAIVNYSKKIESMYLEDEDSKTRKLAAIASEAVSRYSSADKFDLVASAFLPLAFVGRHDGDTGVSTAFDKEWVEYSSGNNAIKLYFHEIFAICDVNIRSNDYNVRQTMARTIVDVCQSIETLLPKEVGPLFTMVLEACKGKSWEGKELVLEALVMISVKNADYLRENSALMDLVVQTIKLEQKRRNKSYQLRVILSVSKFINQFPENRELVESYIDIMRQILTDDYLEDSDIVNVDSLSAVEEWYTSYIRSVVEACPSRAFDDDLFAFALELMRGFKVSGHELTWKTCFSFNENFQSLLIALNAATLNETQLSVVAKELAILTDFKDMYKLEKNVIIFARNVKLSLDLFKKYNTPSLAEQLVKEAQNLLSANISSVARHELEMAIS
ncbi:ARM repeat-containing protein [Metschnikowia bicuspidata var. bicuspidata NRRL YB-4993]|uniref:ARM repeat-containing protein n=1 Tax=Metschnikowia bicuspidata var. bicuspidata NRRL YB-4993 TaxID=869754 RepID=A0A1A0H970_9ASCO|nr:ARM repeat-containing protein [Metschnikowia bicuspidata var. bicuspidata NRRL YB-4993]OBA20432.1 ARM repeat-containing protein [Metschnikowia bicuspidata var. bicuspidata NRRL YB-4993]